LAPSGRGRRRAPFLPSTTLFRSAGDLRDLVVGELLYVTEDDHLRERGRDLVQRLLDVLVLDRALRMSIGREGLIRQLLLVLLVRSEEHTSELQSRENLVCRLLLE